MNDSRTPDLMPVLSRGKHRSPRKGACFMELASYLAGEPWSDHPSCTHPLLAALAREVNDHVQDGARVGLAPLVPEVIGLNGDDPRVDAWIAREAALTALPLVSQEKQNVSAVALILCERQLAKLEGRPEKVSPGTQAALDAVPHARDWARDFISTSWGPQDFSRRSAPAIVHKAVSGIATACVADPDRVLVELLSRTIDMCHEWFSHEPPQVSDDQWRELVRLTHR
jgi:hypothetical protein